MRTLQLAPCVKKGLAWISVALLTSCSQEQDRRSVTEPHIPQTCVRLSASIAAKNEGLVAEDEERLDTNRIQQALDHCDHGSAVELAADGRLNAFLSGPISIPANVTLLIDEGVTLFASRDPRLFDRTPNSCGVVNHEAAGCKPLIAIDDAPHAALIGEGVVDGRGGAKLLHDSITWWDLAEQARRGGRQQVPRLVVADHSDDFSIYRITLRNSPNFHLVYSNGRGFTVWGVRIKAPQRARNTDGIDPGSASDITVTHSIISTGDDHIAIKGSGTGVQHVSVIDNHFYAGHGMSIGSETYAGVSDVLVRGLTIDGADNGLRIKSNIHRGGLVERIRYEDVCIRDTANPITIDTRYDNSGSSLDSLQVPLFRDVAFKDVRIAGGGKLTVDGTDTAHATTGRFDDVRLDQPQAYKQFAEHAHVSYGPGPVDFRLSGDDVTGTVVTAQTHRDSRQHTCTFPSESSASR